MIGGIGTVGVAGHGRPSCTPRLALGVPSMIFGIIGYFVYRKRRGWIRARVTVPRPERPPDFEELEYRQRSCRSSATSRRAPRRPAAPAKLIGAKGVVSTIFVLPVPRRLSLKGQGWKTDAQGRAVLEGARIKARRAGIKIHKWLC